MEAVAGSMILLAAMTASTGKAAGSAAGATGSSKGSEAGAADSSSRQTFDVHAKAKARLKQKRVLLKFTLRCRMQRESRIQAEENAFQSAFLEFEDQNRAFRAAQDLEEKEFQRLSKEFFTAQHEFDIAQQQRKATRKASKSSRTQHQLKFTRAEVAHMNRETLRRILN